MSNSGHSENFLTRFLANPRLYKLFTNLISKKYEQRIVREYIKPFAGCKILDIGCGPANLLTYLPDSIGEYSGFDMNQAYIQYAQKKWEQKENYHFYCRKVEGTSDFNQDYFDFVIALGIVHHLQDDEAGHLFEIAHHVLKQGGTLITYDNVFVENQNPVAKWLISKDRGKSTRTVEGYRQLANKYFSNIEGTIVNDMLRLPYTVYIMQCKK